MTRTVALLAAACGSAPATRPGVGPPPPFTTTDTATPVHDSAAPQPIGEWRYLTVSGWFAWDAAAGEVVDARLDGVALPSTIRLTVFTSAWIAGGYDLDLTEEYCSVDLLFRAGPPASTQGPDWDRNAFAAFPHSDDPADVVTTCAAESATDLGVSLFGPDPVGRVLAQEEPWSIGVGANIPELTFAAHGLRGRVYDPTTLTRADPDDYTAFAYPIDPDTHDVIYRRDGRSTQLTLEEVWDGTTLTTGFYLFEGLSGFGYDFVPF